MADCATDPRWFRTYGTFGEEPELISEIITRVIRGNPGRAGGRKQYRPHHKAFPGRRRKGKTDLIPIMPRANTTATQPPEVWKPIICGLPRSPSRRAHPRSCLITRYRPTRNPASAERSGGFRRRDRVCLQQQFINGTLRGEMGFTGIVNSDTGVLSGMGVGRGGIFQSRPRGESPESRYRYGIRRG